MGEEPAPKTAACPLPGSALEHEQSRARWSMRCLCCKGPKYERCALRWNLGQKRAPSSGLIRQACHRIRYSTWMAGRSCSQRASHHWGDSFGAMTSRTRQTLAAAQEVARARKTKPESVRPVWLPRLPPRTSGPKIMVVGLGRQSSRGENQSRDS